MSYFLRDFNPLATGVSYIGIGAMVPIPGLDWDRGQKKVNFADPWSYMISMQVTRQSTISLVLSDVAGVFYVI